MRHLAREGPRKKRLHGEEGVDEVRTWTLRENSSVPFCKASLAFQPSGLGAAGARCCCPALWLQCWGEGSENCTPCNNPKVFK